MESSSRGGPKEIVSFYYRPPPYGGNFLDCGFSCLLGESLCPKENVSSLSTPPLPTGSLTWHLELSGHSRLYDLGSLVNLSRSAPTPPHPAIPAIFSGDLP